FIGKVVTPASEGRQRATQILARGVERAAPPDFTEARYHTGARRRPYPLAVRTPSRRDASMKLCIVQGGILSAALPIAIAFAAWADGSDGMTDLGAAYASTAVGNAGNTQTSTHAGAGGGATSASHGSGGSGVVSTNAGTGGAAASTSASGSDATSSTTS